MIKDLRKKYRYEVQLLCYFPKIYQILAKVYCMYMFGE
jgi:hypothetical protein